MIKAIDELAVLTSKHGWFWFWLLVLAAGSGCDLCVKNQAERSEGEAGPRIVPDLLLLLLLRLPDRPLGSRAPAPPAWSSASWRRRRVVSPFRRCSPTPDVKRVCV